MPAIPVKPTAFSQLLSDLTVGEEGAEYRTVDGEKIKKTLQAYSDTSTLSKKIYWAANRVFNAIKSLFGKSDWQIAKKMVIEKLDVTNFSSEDAVESLNKMLEYASSFFNRNLQDEEERKIRKEETEMHAFLRNEPQPQLLAL